MADVLTNLSIALRDPTAFHAGSWATWMRENYDLVIYLAFGYCGFVFMGQRFMRDREPLKLKWLFTLWNFILAAFSLVGASHVVPSFVATILAKGETYILCEPPNSWFMHGGTGLWMGLFIWSKIPELVDTVFLVFQKKPVIFLHWYHHTTVMLYCWFAYAHGTPCGIWFAAMNYFVHSIMYSYYFLMNLSGVTRAAVKPVAPLITFLQIAQMVVGLYVAVRSLFVFNESRVAGTECHARPAETRMAVVMYFSYFLLFAQLFYRLYIGGGGRAKSAKSD